MAIIFAALVMKNSSLSYFARQINGALLLAFYLDMDLFEPFMCA